jgi:hypothetical protein
MSETRATSSDTRRIERLLHRNGSAQLGAGTSQRRSWSRRVHHVSCTPDSCRSCRTSENFRVVPVSGIQSPGGALHGEGGKMMPSTRAKKALLKAL